MKIHKYLLCLIVPVFFLTGCATGKDLKDVGGKDKRALSGGATTVFDDTKLAFSLPAANLSTKQLGDFTFGNRLFNTNWVIAPSSTKKFDGLGPVFNRVSCSACHTFDGRGRPPDEGEPMQSMLVRLSVPGTGEQGGVKPHPHYGDQLNERGIPGVLPEGRTIVRYGEVKGQYPDGSSYTLRVPRYEFVDLAFGPLGKDILFSPRVAPAVFGLGLLEMVPEETILNMAKAQQDHPDKVAGQPNYVWDVQQQKTVLGRFGWKANQPSLSQQAAGAFVGDIGITNPVFPKEDIPAVQQAALNQPNGGAPEIDADFFEKILFYSHTLGVPARRGLNDKQALQGEKVFNKIGCATCHVPTMATGPSDKFPQLANQVIHPYTDLLLHDMGEGLADNRPDFQATGRQWRTPPLWGIGLVKTVNKHSFFLHDGRARNLEEAILWHGGQAQKPKERFKKLSRIERNALVKFLESL